MHSHTTILVSFLIFAVILHATTISNAAPSYDPETLNELTQMLLRRRDDMLSTKRGLDLGFDRGYSGKMAAKYLTGLEMAGPLGPGRKRRSGSGSETNFPIYLMDNDKHMAYWNNNENIKRGLDMGFGRGFSGVQAARHLIGLEEANDAMGPGRRRRSISDITA